MFVAIAVLGAVEALVLDFPVALCHEEERPAAHSVARKGAKPARPATRIMTNWSW
jgi:hypothetical protein